MHRLGGLVRVVAVQPIQGELNAIEIAAQSDLIRVLTHEIMNSMTPVTSLAHSAVDLMRGLDTNGKPEVLDARAAVETLARRADGVMHFVESYRQISRAPQVRARPIDVAAWGAELEALFRASDGAAGVEFSLNIGEDLPGLEADPDLMSQVLINLLRNAAEDARSQDDKPAVSLTFLRTRAGRTQIEVEDNGAGVPDALRRISSSPSSPPRRRGPASASASPGRWCSPTAARSMSPRGGKGRRPVPDRDLTRVGLVSPFRPSPVPIRMREWGLSSDPFRHRLGLSGDVRDSDASQKAPPGHRPIA